VKGDVVVLNFPFSDLSQTKRRPALVLAALLGDDLILCQITSQAREDGYSVRLDASDFVSGGLSQSSRIRPNRLFTADSGVVVYRAGHVSAEKLRETIDKLVSILDA
jgi:mRNA interferase MazF